ncbi:MAG: SDR family oxidoreductase [Clostridia bacterium]|nr:SDR family oxidoreductase [Clostridia bacterium]
MSLLNNFSLEGKNVIVTGASKGIGYGVAKELAKAGARVALVARTQSLLETCKKEIEEAGGKADVFTADIRNVASIRSCVAEIEKAYGKIDGLFNNAGMGNPIPAYEIEEADWDEMMDLNLKGEFFFAQAVANCMKKTGGGKICMMSSQASVVAIPGESIYCASKGGVNMLTKVFAVEWAKDNINVNAIGPTFIYTPGTAERLDNPEFYQGVVSKIPLNRVGTINDVASAVIYFLSDASSMLTGTLLLVDGGWTLE